MLLSQRWPLCGSISQRKKNCCHSAFCLTLHLRNEGGSHIHRSAPESAQGWARLSWGGWVALPLPLKVMALVIQVLFTLLSKGPLKETSSFLHTVSSSPLLIHLDISYQGDNFDLLECGLWLTKENKLLASRFGVWFWRGTKTFSIRWGALTFLSGCKANYPCRWSSVIPVLQHSLGLLWFPSDNKDL